MNLPNVLTVFRALLIPVFAGLFYRAAYPAALLVFLLASATDFLDGYLARKWGQVTRFGKLMDPLADKLMLLTVLFSLADTGYVPWWVVFVMLGKDALLILGAALLLNKKVVVMADWSGKIATILFIIAVFAVFPWHSYAWLTQVGNVLIYVAVAVSMVALVNYAVYYFKNSFSPGKDA